MKRLLTIVLALVWGANVYAQSGAAAAHDAAFDANPTFQVATVKPSAPDETGWSTMIRGHHFVTVNTNVTDLVAYAYGVHVKQIIGPEWFGREKFDIEGVPDTDAMPTRDQFRVMVQKLLGERFKLAFHHERRVLPVYVLTVDKGGAKLQESATPENHSGWGIGDAGLMVKGMTMDSFAKLMQRTVLDRPVVDHTGLTGRYDITLKWRPDESEFLQLRGAGIQPMSGKDAEALPGLYTAIREQLGLRLEATKALDDVMVIDHAERPSAD